MFLAVQAISAHLRETLLSNIYAVENASVPKVLTVAGRKTDKCISPPEAKASTTAFYFSNNFLDPIFFSAASDMIRALSNGTTPTCA